MGLLYIWRHFGASLLELTHELVIKNLLPTVNSDTTIAPGLVFIRVIIEVSRMVRCLPAKSAF